jgi:predicted phage-related endonuclease
MSNSTNVNAVELTIEATLALDTFIQAKKAKKEAEEALRGAEKALREALGEAITGNVNGVPAVKVIASKNSHINKEALETEYPEIYAQTLVTSPYTYLKTL